MEKVGFSENSQAPQRSKINFWHSFKIFLLLYIVLVVVVGMIIGLIYFLEAKNEKIAILSAENHRLDMVDKNIKDSFQSVVSDIEIAIAHEELKDYAESGDIKYAELLADDIMAISKSKKAYDQIAVLDKTGMEIVRVHYNNGKPYIADKNKLQYRGKENYFENAFSLNTGEIYISSIDPVARDEASEAPLKLIIRFSTPFFDSANKQKGLIVFNFKAEKLLKDIDDLYLGGVSRVNILNKDGHYLKANTLDSRSGFADKDKTEWQNIASEKKGQIESYEGVYTFSAVYPLSFTSEANNKNYYWHIVSFVPKEFLRAKAGKLLLNLFVLSSVLLFIMLVFVWILARSIVKKRQAEKIIIELNDLLETINKILRHDITNKLTTIQLALESYNRYEDKDGLKLAEESAASGVKLIKRMRKLEVLANTGNTTRAVSVDATLNEVVREYDIPIEIEGRGVVLADHALRSVFDNIIRNAITHGKTSKMQISITKAKGKTRIELADFGQGIPDSIKDKVFEEGFKYGDTAKSGLGLYIVKKTVERYGGRIIVRPNKPRGVVFIILLVSG